MWGFEEGEKGEKVFIAQKFARLVYGVTVTQEIAPVPLESLERFLYFFEYLGKLFLLGITEAFGWAFRQNGYNLGNILEEVGVPGLLELSPDEVVCYMFRVLYRIDPVAHTLLQKGVDDDLGDFRAFRTF